MVIFEVNKFKNTPKIIIKKHHKWIDKTLSKTESSVPTFVHNYRIMACEYGLRATGKQQILDFGLFITKMNEHE